MKKGRNAALIQIQSGPVKVTDYSAAFAIGLFGCVVQFA